MDNCLIRRLKQEDVPQVAALEKSCFSVPWSFQSLYEDIVENELARYYGVFCGDALVAYMGYWKVLDQAHITNVAVAPGKRKRGLGSRLFGHVLASAASEGIASLTLEVRPSNTAALALYHAFGLKEMGRRKHYYSDNGEDALILWLDALPYPQQR